jgi:hypothetical protein
MNKKMNNVAFIKGHSGEWQNISDRLANHGFETVLWISHVESDNKHYLHQDAILARRPLFLKEQQLIPIDKKLLTLLSYKENILFEMVNRWSLDSTLDHDSVRDYLNRLASIWLSIIRVKKINYLIFATTPHRVYDYVAYLVAKTTNTKVVIAERTTFDGLGFFYQSIENRSKDLYLNQHGNPKINAEDVIRSYRSSYDEAKPKYLKKKEIKVLDRKILHPQNVFFNYKVRIFIDILRRIKDHSLRKIIPTYIKFNKNSGVQPVKGYEFSISNLFAIRRIENAIDWYQEHSTSPIIGEKYIYFSPNYQHERSTCPDAGIFHDYYLILNILYSNLPKGWQIYIKEHPSSHSQKSINNNRSIDLYKRWLSVGENIKLISMSENQFSLIDNSEIVVTATGTVALESISRNRPAMVFGDTWFKSAPGIWHVTSELECKDAIKELREYTFNKIDLHQYYVNVFNSLINLSRESVLDPDVLARSILSVIHLQK